MVQDNTNISDKGTHIHGLLSLTFIPSSLALIFLLSSLQSCLKSSHFFCFSQIFNFHNVIIFCTLRKLLSIMYRQYWITKNARWILDVKSQQDDHQYSCNGALFQKFPFSFIINQSLQFNLEVVYNLDKCYLYNLYN